MSPAWLGEELSDKIKESGEFHHEHSQQIAQDIIATTLDLTAFVERLSGVLTDTNPEYRARGIHLFSKVLSHFPSDYLAESQLKFISTFFIDRLQDNHRVIPPVIEGLLSIVNMKHLPKDAPCKILSAIDKNVPCQQQVRTDRTIIYNIYQTLVQKYPTEMKSLGPDFVYAVISALDGERDPRNLLLLFTFLPNFLKNFSLHHLTEEMFDVIACYYPVDFNPPQDDPDAITRNDLAEKLCICLCNIPQFAEFCMPLLLEKLDSDLKLAKLDSLKLLAHSCNTFKPENYEVHLPTLWKYLQNSIMNKSDPEISAAAHEALAALIKTLCSHDDVNIGTTFMKQIIDSMKILLADAKTKALLAQPLQVFVTSTNASERSCIYFTENTVPLLILHHHLNLDSHLQVLSFEWFLTMYNTCKAWSVLSQTGKVFAELPKMCLTSLNSNDDQLKVCCFKSLSGLADIIESTEIAVLFEIFDNNLCKDNSKTVEEANKQCLISLSQAKPDLFKDFVFSKLEVEQLPESNGVILKHLNVLCSLISVQDYADVIMIKFIQIFRDNNITTVGLLFGSLCNNFENKELFKNITIAHIQKKYDIIKCVLERVHTFMQFFEDICKLIITILRVMESNDQMDLLSVYVPEYLEKSHANESYINILEALLNSTKQDVNIPNVDKLMSHTTNLALNGQNEMVQYKSRLILANILNKYINNELVHGQYELIKRELGKRLDVNHDELTTINSIHLGSWICKSFFLNGHEDSKYWLQTLIQILYTSKWSLETAKVFKLIVNDPQDALNASCFCKVNFLHQQKIFHTFSQITTNMQNVLPKDHDKKAYLLAYVYIIQSVPKTVIQLEAQKISSVLIESLSFSDKDLLYASLSILSHLIESKNTSVLGSLQSLIPKCIKLASFKDSMQVRIGSLQCLYSVANCYPTILILPYKEDLVYQLAAPLDDPKRLVRGIAVKARSRWFLVGAPGGEKLK